MNRGGGAGSRAEAQAEPGRQERAGHQEMWWLSDPHPGHVQGPRKVPGDPMRGSAFRLPSAPGGVLPVGCQYPCTSALCRL